MSYELNLYVNGRVCKAFLQAPYMTEQTMNKMIHHHKYSEIHLVQGGSVTLLMEKEIYTFPSGTVYHIPADRYHCYLEAEPKTRLIAFQADLCLNGFLRRVVSEPVLAELVDRMSAVRFDLDASALSALLSFACSAFFEPLQVQRTNDSAVIIYEFISKNYNRSVQLSELAEQLKLSEKQTERLVKLHMGVPFKTAVVNYRMTVARFLKENTAMRETEIAAYVGYSNYSGYWKAQKSLMQMSKDCKSDS